MKRRGLIKFLYVCSVHLDSLIQTWSILILLLFIIFKNTSKIRLIIRVLGEKKSLDDKFVILNIIESTNWLYPQFQLFEIAKKS